MGCDLAQGFYVAPALRPAESSAGSPSATRFPRRLDRATPTFAEVRSTFGPTISPVTMASSGTGSQTRLSTVASRPRPQDRRAEDDQDAAGLPPEPTP